VVGRRRGCPPAARADRPLLEHLDRKGYGGYIGLEYRPPAGQAEDSFGWLKEYGWARR
jgi:hydroxypyruvate isomerase